MRRHLPPMTLLLASALAQGKIQPITEERLQAAYTDARAAVGSVLRAEVDQLPPLRLVDAKAMIAAIAAENLPAVQLRQPDTDKAKAEAEQLAKAIGSLAYAKYAWSSHEFLVVTTTWERTARILRRPQLTADQALRAVMVHELCHALDDQRFHFGERLLAATTADAMTALNAVIEGHAQVQTRRVCAANGWDDGFAAFTGSITALPDNGLIDPFSMLQLRGNAQAMTLAYLDGERFAAAVLAARPETGSADLFTAPPPDAETILRPEWYLDPASRPVPVFDVEPALDAFVQRFDPAAWQHTRNSVTGRQLASGLLGVGTAEVEHVVATVRACRMVQLNPTAAPDSKVAILALIEFADAEAANRWLAIARAVSDHKDETMDKGMVRIVDSTTTEREHDGIRMLVQEKSMRNGKLAFDVVAIDAVQGALVVETIYSGEPPALAEHLRIVGDTFAAVRKRQ